MRKSPEKIVLMGASICSVVILVLAGLFCARIEGGCSFANMLFTSNQQGQRLYNRKEYLEASDRFIDPDWRAAALFRAGEYEKAAGILIGLSSAESHYNLGNSLVMQGLYEKAVEQFDEALTIRPDWEDAKINRAIAAGRAKRLERKGGEMTEGQMEADEISFDTGKETGESAEPDDGEAVELSDTDVRRMWLRNVETKPADFLRYKFAYQYAKQSE